MSGEPPSPLVFDNAAQWEAWLTEHHAWSSDAWLVIAKKGSQGEGLSITDAAETALCFGWIDSLRKARDRGTFLQRYSPRRPTTPWSRINVDLAEALITQGRMRPAGQAQIEAARADGRWAAAYAPQANVVLPADVQAAFLRDRAAAEAYERLSKSARYALLLPILRAVRYKTRAQRVEKLIAGLQASTDRPSDGRDRDA